MDKKYYALRIVRSSGNVIRILSFQGDEPKKSRDAWVAEPHVEGKNLEGKRMAISSAVAKSTAKQQALRISLMRFAEN